MHDRELDHREFITLLGLTVPFFLSDVLIEQERDKNMWLTVLQRGISPTEHHGKERQIVVTQVKEFFLPLVEI